MTYDQKPGAACSSDSNSNYDSVFVAVSWLARNMMYMIWDYAKAWVQLDFE